MPWLTPDSIPETDTCRSLFIPADSTWLALLSGALTELTKAYNWQQFGSLTVDETVTKMSEILDGYYSEPCSICFTPGGYRVARISPSGHVEVLDDSGNWVGGEDEYHIPPPEPRTEGTEPDQNCLAAKNAVNVLQQLYENLSDSWNDHLEEAEAGTAFVLGLTALVGFEFAPITWSIVAFLAPVFTALYATLEWIGADLWDENVSKQIECFLLDCAINTDGVVTFDWDCFIAKLVSLTDDFSLTETQLRLYLQISYILYFMGGADGLNLAGRTTAITEDDCSFCPSGGSLCVGFDEGDHYEFYTNPEGSLAPVGHLNPDGGNPLPSGHSDQNFSYSNWQLWVSVRIDLGAARTITDASYDFFVWSDAPGGAFFRGIYFYDEDMTLITSQTTADMVAQSEWLTKTYTGGDVSNCRYVMAVVGQSSGSEITGELSVDNICATWI